MLLVDDQDPWLKPGANSRKAVHPLREGFSIVAGIMAFRAVSPRHIGKYVLAKSGKGLRPDMRALGLPTQHEVLVLNMALMKAGRNLSGPDAGEAF